MPPKSLTSEKVGDLPTCISDIEAMIPDVEKVIADFKAGNTTQALADLLTIAPEAQKAYTDCTASVESELKDLPTCIADIEAAIPDVEKIIADFKAGNYTQALTDALALEPEATKAYADCTASKPKSLTSVRDLPTCIADIEALIPGVEKVIAAVKAGNESEALIDLLALEAPATKAYADCTASKKGPLGDLPTCIADIEAMIPDVEKVIADFKGGNYEQALTDAMALAPEAEKAYTDCTASLLKGKILRKMNHIMHKLGKVQDLTTCIADIEALIPGVEKVIADIKAGNESQALMDLLAMEADATKAYTDCTAGAKDMKKKIKGVLTAKVNDDPKREYFEKMGA